MEWNINLIKKKNIRVKQSYDIYVYTVCFYVEAYF